MSAVKLYRSGVLKAHAPELGAAQRLADASLIVAIHGAACAVYTPHVWQPSSTVATAVAVVVFYLVAETISLYRSWRGAPVLKEVVQVLTAWGITVPVLLFTAFATKTTADFSRVVTTGWFVTTPLALMIWRLGVRAVLRAMRARGHNTRTVAVAGATRVAVRLLRTLKKDPALGLRVVGIYDDRIRRRPELPDDLAEYTGTLNQLVEDARAGKFDIVYITLPLRACQRAG